MSILYSVLGLNYAVYVLLFIGNDFVVPTKCKYLIFILILYFNFLFFFCVFSIQWMRARAICLLNSCVSQLNWNRYDSYVDARQTPQKLNCMKFIKLSATWNAYRVCRRIVGIRCIYMKHCCLRLSTYTRICAIY